MLQKIKSFFAPAPHKELLPEHEVKRLYPKYRWSILESTFIGYATFYLVRNNLSVVSKDMQTAMSYDANMIGNILAISAITYGLGKFLMGSVSDRSNVKRFMPLGLLLTAFCNFAFGSVESYSIHLLLWAMNGFIQGMGWPPCGRSIGHWFSISERGTIFAIWNIAHNIGGGLAGVIAAGAVIKYGGWQYAFYVPGAIALIGAIYLFIRLKDTPQSEGLPPIEEFRNDYVEGEAQATHETELSAKELFVTYILKNKFIWLFAIANFFVYIVRYSMLDWGALYLREVKGADLTHGGIAILVLEFGGIPSTLLMGWISDKVGGRRGMVSLLCMIPILGAFLGILLNPEGNLWFDMTMLATIGFFVYPPVMMLGVAGLDFTSKKAVGTAAGFIGLFGYMGRTAQAKGFGWMNTYLTDLYSKQVAWDYIIYVILGCTVLSILLLSFTWKLKPKA